MTRLLIIGGSDAGISAALRARELDPSVEATIVVADEFPNYSICGIPFYLSGEVADWRDLAHRKAKDIEKEGIKLLLNHKAEDVDPVKRTVTVLTPGGEMEDLGYDRLVIATGAVSTRPPIEGLDLPGVYLMRWMQDALGVNEWLTEQNPKEVVQVGAGYVGLEMADALTRRGIKVTLIEVAPQVLQTLDPDLAGTVSDIVSQQGVAVVTGTGVESISKKEGKLLVSGSGNFSQATDMVIVAAGGTPRISLALAAGASTGVAGAIQVDRRMETKVPDVFAAGDCTETWHRVLAKNVYLPLGTTAHKQGRIAGENALGGDRQFMGTLGTQVVKVFDRVVARTGLRDREAREAGFDPVSVDTESWDHKQYYPGAKKITIRMTGDSESGRFLGAQMIGYHGSEVSKRVDVCAAALYHGMKVEEINDLDLSYTPPLSSPWDPVQMAAQEWVKKRI